MTSMTDQLQGFLTGEKTCLIWGTECQEKIQDADSITVVASPRAGGDYVIDRSVFPELRRLYAADSSNEFANMLRARLTTILVKRRQLDNDLPRITASTLDEAKSAGPARMDERLANLLRFLVDNTPMVGEPVRINSNDDMDKNLQYSLANSESTDRSEVEFLIGSLERLGWITRSLVGFRLLITVTADGYSEVEKSRSVRNTEQCFIAMWFNQETDALYDKAIAPAVRAAGYQPIRIDQQTNFLGKIDDQITAEIPRSKFVIADFTHGDDGPRGSVYYEVGFAHALDIPVIFTCRDDQMEGLPFDTNHYPHLPWSADAPEALIEPLKNRVVDNLGPGPHGTGG